MPEKKFLKKVQAFGKTEAGRKFLEKVSHTLATGQSPGVFLISCSDSRILPDRVAEPGEVFQYKNVAEVVSVRDMSFGAALEYFAKHLKGKNVVVLGHANCGGMGALHSSEKPAAHAHGEPDLYIPEQLKEAKEALTARAKLTKGMNIPEADRINMLIELNTLLQKSNIEVMLKGMGVKGLKVHSWMYQSDGTFATRLETLAKHRLLDRAAKHFNAYRARKLKESASFFRKLREKAKPKEKKAKKKAPRRKR